MKVQEGFQGGRIECDQNSLYSYMKFLKNNKNILKYLVNWRMQGYLKDSFMGWKILNISSFVRKIKFIFNGTYSTFRFL